jgi:hypothetical protein
MPALAEPELVVQVDPLFVVTERSHQACGA